MLPRRLSVPAFCRWNSDSHLNTNADRIATNQRSIRPEFSRWSSGPWMNQSFSRHDGENGTISEKQETSLQTSNMTVKKTVIAAIKTWVYLHIRDGHQIHCPQDIMRSVCHSLRQGRREREITFFQVPIVSWLHTVSIDGMIILRNYLLTK